MYNYTPRQIATTYDLWCDFVKKNSQRIAQKIDCGFFLMSTEEKMYQIKRIGKYGKNRFPKNLRPPTKTQIELIKQLQKIRGLSPYQFMGLNTHKINEQLGNYQSYESYLRNRLFRLENLGFLEKVEGRYNVNRTLTERIWKFTEQGWLWTPSYEDEYPLPDEYPF